MCLPTQPMDQVQEAFKIQESFHRVATETAQLNTRTIIEFFNKSW